MYANAKYYKDTATAETIGIMVEINGVASFVPIDPANTDYEKVMALVGAGKLVIAPAEGGN